MRTPFCAVFLLSFCFSFAQPTKKDKISLFIDCRGTRCDMNYIRPEINLVDFILDSKAADVYVLITEQRSGGGGSLYQLMFFGQNQFKNHKDTVLYYTEANATEFERREELVRNLKLGLVPYILKTNSAKNLAINLKGNDSTEVTNSTTDKWNYWTFTVGANGSMNGEKTYQGLRYSGNFSARRITDLIKVTFAFNASKNKATYIIEDPTGLTPTEKIVYNNNDWSFFHQLVKSMNQHWSYGYSSSLNNSTYSNYQLQAVINPAIEYDIFPYSQSNTKWLTFRYGLDFRHHNYIDTTIYNKKQENLLGHGISASLSLAQKWGGSYIGLGYHQYFKDQGKYFSVGLNGNFNVRVTGGLSVNLNFYGGIVRDQINLSGKDVSQQDVLLRRRQLASNYSYSSSFGINYRFGSNLNNFVNPRFN